MGTITLIINDAPYGIEKPWNALRSALDRGNFEDCDFLMK